MTRIAKRVSMGAALALAMTAVSLGFAGAAYAYATVPCSAYGVTNADSELAQALNYKLTGTLRGYLTGYRISCARQVVNTVRSRGLPVRAATIAITTTIVESTIQNISEEVDHDSLGLFQQRASWGSREQRLDPVWATNAFLNKMLSLYPNGSWQNVSVGTVCQAVQVSAYPDRYATQAADGATIASALWSGPVIAVGADGTQMIVDPQGRVHAKQGVGLYGWTLESDASVKAVATNGGTQMILDSAGKVWAKNGIGLYGWTLESDGGNVAIAVGSDGTQMVLDSQGQAWAKNGISLYGWTRESDPGVKAIATNGGVQMIIGSDGNVWAKNSIGLYGWTRESDAAKAIAVSSGGTQMILDPQGQVLAKNGIGLYGWTLESDPGTIAIAIGSDGTQMILDSQSRVHAKQGVGLYGWTRESDPGVKAIATNGGVQMIIGSDGNVWAKNSIGLYGWTRESDPIA